MIVNRHPGEIHKPAAVRGFSCTQSNRWCRRHPQLVLTLQVMLYKPIHNARAPRTRMGKGVILDEALYVLSEFRFLSSAHRP